jgi:hypothetical protein
VFCEAVQHRLWFCLDHLSCVKMLAFQFCLQSGKQRRVGWTEHDSQVVLGDKFLTEKGTVRQCNVLLLQSVTAVHGTVWPARTNSLWTIPVMSKKFMSMLLTLLFARLALFGLP